MDLCADGPDAAQALDELAALVRQFHEQED
jgi:phosphotransferase system HPr-like phosphotransfer protein